MAHVEKEGDSKTRIDITTADFCETGDRKSNCELVAV
jgi:hypothetical protein